jgi:hypothetical protein
MKEDWRKEQKDGRKGKKNPQVSSAGRIARGVVTYIPVMSSARFWFCSRWMAKDM